MINVDYKFHSNNLLKIDNSIFACINKIFCNNYADIKHQKYLLIMNDKYDNRNYDYNHCGCKYGYLGHYDRIIFICINEDYMSKNPDNIYIFLINKRKIIELDLNLINKYRKLSVFS